MNEVELAAVFFATLLALLASWSPANYQTIDRDWIVPTTPKLQLAQLMTLLEVSTNFNHAYQKWNATGRPLGGKLEKRLQQISDLSHNYGLSATQMVRSEENRLSVQNALKDLWDELSTPAKSTSKLLILLPILTHLIALSIGIDATRWLFTNSFGIGLFVFATALTLLSLKYQRRNPLVASRLKTLSAHRASLFVFLSVCIWQPSIQGVVLASVGALLIGDSWSALLAQSNQESLRNRKFEHTWELTIVIAALQTGLGWNEVLQLVESHVSEEERQELIEIRFRIEQGALPAIAFSSSALWSDIGQSLTYAQNEGSKIVPVLNALRESTIREYKNFQEIRLRRQAQVLTVVVSALQLPAFLALGLVPIAAEPIFELVNQFSSTIAVT